MTKRKYSVFVLLTGLFLTSHVAGESQNWQEIQQEQQQRDDSQWQARRDQLKSQDQREQERLLQQKLENQRQADQAWERKQEERRLEDRRRNF